MLQGTVAGSGMRVFPKAVRMHACQQTSTRVMNEACSWARRSIIVLESNTGYTQLHGMLVEAGDRSLARPRVAC